MHGLETERLIFQEVKEADAEFICELLNEPGYITHISDRGIRTPEEAKDYISERFVYGDDGFGFYLLRERETGEEIGIAGTLKRDFLDHPDLGYALLRRHEGKGYAFEAASAVLAYGLNDLELGRVGAIVSAQNGRSIHLLKKLGLVYEKDVAYPGEEVPVQLYLNPKDEA